MIFKLTKFKRDPWSGHTTYNFCSVNIAPETNKRGLPATGMTPTESKQMEKELFMTAGHLSENNEEFWGKYFIPFPKDGKEFDDEHPNDKLALYVLRAMKKVANGRDDLKKKARAEFMLTSEQKVEQEDDEKFSVKEKAYGLLSDASPTKHRQIYSVLMKSKKNGIVVDVSSMTDKAIKNGLRTAIEANALSFNTVVEDPKLAIKAEIIELVSKRIVAFGNNQYSYEGNALAYDLDSMVEYMEDPHRQDMVIRLKNELKAKK